jgi:hypothetical protein
MPGNINGRNTMLITNRDDDSDLLVGCRRMSEFATAEGYPVSTSTLQKRVSPAIATGPELVGYFGRLPATDKGRMRAWLRTNLRSDRPASKRQKAPAITSRSVRAGEGS